MCVGYMPLTGTTTRCKLCNKKL